MLDSAVMLLAETTTQALSRSTDATSVAGGVLALVVGIVALAFSFTTGNPNNSSTVKAVGAGFCIIGLVAVYVGIFGLSFPPGS